MKRHLMHSVSVASVPEALLHISCTLPDLWLWKNLFVVTLNIMRFLSETKKKLMWIHFKLNKFLFAQVC